MLSAREDLRSADGSTRVAIRNTLLIVSAKSCSEQERVTASWISAGGDVLCLDRFWTPPPLDASKARLYGALPFCLDLSSRLKLSLVTPPDDLLFQLDSYWVGRNIWPVALGEAAKLKYPLFLKSVQPKLIKSGVYHSGDALLFESCGLPPHTSLAAAEVIDFSIEWRLFVLYGEIVADGVYVGASADRKRMLTFASDFLRHAKLPDTCVVDVGRTTGGRWVIIEVNPVWGAGLRGCHPDPVIHCIALATRSLTPEA
jgi:hypothetical protein